MEKEWYKSKAIWGALLIATAGVLNEAGKLLTGQTTITAAIVAVMPYIGNAAGILGIRLAMR